MRRARRQRLQPRRPPLGLLAAAVVRLRGDHARVSHPLLHQADVRARIQQIAGEGAPEVVRREGIDARITGPALEHAARDAERNRARLPNRSKARVPARLDGKRSRCYDGQCPTGVTLAPIHLCRIPTLQLWRSPMLAVQSSAGRFGRFRPLVLALLVGVGCTDQHPSALTEPLLNASNQVGHARSGEPFYYFQGKRIPLIVDTERLVIKFKEPTAEARASAVLGQALGQTVRIERAMATRPDHRIVRLGRGASATALRASAEQLRRTDGVEFVSLAYNTADEGHEFVPLNRIMVEFQSGTTEAQIDEINRRFGTRTLRATNPDSAWFFHILGFPEQLDREPMELVAELYEHELVKWADVDKITDRRQASTPTDPYYLGHQYYLYNTYLRNGVRVDVNVSPTWQVTKGEGIPSAGGMTVAVIDDGVHAAHPDLNVAFLGYDYFGNNSGLGCSDCAFSPYGDDIHGTAVAGIIGAQHDGVGAAGIAPAAYIVPLRIFRNSYHPNPNYAEWAGEVATAQAIDFAWYLAGAHVINNSWGGGAASDAIASAINRAATSGRGGLGTVVVFAAGNTSDRDFGHIGSVQFPARLALFYPILSVGAINRYGQLTNYTPRANLYALTKISVVAPSGHYTGRCVGDVVTTELVGSPGCQDGPNGNGDYTSTFSGTSAAAPQVSGAAVLLLSKNPQMTASQVVQRIQDTADSWGSSNDFGAGKLNIGRMLPPPPPPPTEPPPCEPEPHQIVCEV